MVVTGRNFVSVMQPLKDTGLVCDYVVSSGAVIRNPQKEIVLSIDMGFDECEYLYNQLKKHPIGILFCSEEMNHILGTHEEVVLQEIKKELVKNENLAVSSSLKTNLEVTHVRAQKGPILKQYIESLGYSMDEVMVLGDSLNDLSMMKMDFGATIAMENADEEIKRVAKYITKSNEDDGVAYVIDEMLKMYGLE